MLKYQHLTLKLEPCMNTLRKRRTKNEAANNAPVNAFNGNHPCELMAPAIGDPISNATDINENSMPSRTPRRPKLGDMETTIFGQRQTTAPNENPYRKLNTITPGVVLTAIHTNARMTAVRTQIN